MTDAELLEQFEKFLAKARISFPGGQLTTVVLSGIAWAGKEHALIIHLIGEQVTVDILTAMMGAVIRQMSLVNGIEIEESLAKVEAHIRQTVSVPKTNLM